jgi:hypothetical protein
VRGYPRFCCWCFYNGERRWKAATTTSGLIALSPDSALWPWQPEVIGWFRQHEGHEGYERLQGLFALSRSLVEFSLRANAPRFGVSTTTLVTGSGRQEEKSLKQLADETQCA